jgi:hypothetical protein
MKKVAALGEPSGVVMALENHSGVNAAQLSKLREDVGSPGVAFTLDTGDFPPESRVGPWTYPKIRHSRSFRRCWEGMIHGLQKN